MLTQTVVAMDRVLADRSAGFLLAVSVCGVAAVAYVDFLTGYEVSMSLFYLGPIAMAAWYVGAWPGVSIALLSALSWYLADTGHPYSHPSIPVWNAMVRLEVFLVFALLLKALRDHVANEVSLAQTDDLTSLFGRRAFFERLEHDLAIAQRRNSAISIAFVDLDDFKAVNDTHGHAEGDRVLRTIGRVMRRMVRRTDTAARLGGDEFAIILPDSASEGARRAISALTRNLRTALDEIGAKVTCSIGVVTCLDARMSADQAIAAADALMYEVKRKGKNSVDFSVVGETQPADSAHALRTTPR